MAKPKKNVTFYDEAFLMAQEDGYDLHTEITNYTHHHFAAKNAEEALKGKFVGKVKIESGLIDRLLAFMRLHNIERLSLGDYVLDRYASVSVNVSTTKLKELGVSQEILDAATVRNPYETITLR